MNTEVLGVIAQIVLMVVLSYPLGKYIAKVYKGEKTWSDFMKPVERVMFKLSGINPNEEMNWKQFLRALLVVNLFWFLWGMVLLVTQGVLPLNPDGNVGQTAHQAFNTCISFMVNCNLQHYSGESGLGARVSNAYPTCPSLGDNLAKVRLIPNDISRRHLEEIKDLSVMDGFFRSADKR